MTQRVNMKGFASIIVVLSMVTAGFFGSDPTSAQRFEGIEINKKDRGSDFETIISIPVESGTFAYENLNKNEATPYGPNSISVTDEGNVLVGNWVDNSATEISLSGEILAKVKFHEAAAINDVRKIGDRFYALDRSAESTQVVVDLGESVITDEKAFRFSDVRGTGELRVAELDGGEKVLNNTSKRSRLPNLVVSPGRPFDADPNVVKIWRGKILIAEWKATNPIAETHLLGSLANGDFFVEVYEMIGTTSILFDQRVIRFNAGGNITGMARVPQDQYYNIANDAALSPNGNVYVLMPMERTLDVIQLHFKRDLPELKISKPEAENYQASAAVVGLYLPSITRQQIENIANYYFGTYTYIPSNRIAGTCRVKPSYLTGAGQYRSVPYSWGGWDSPLDFANKMSGSTVILAGHVANYYSTCSVRPAGIDCSGAVGQMWGNPGHPFSTRDVISNGYAKVIDWSQLRKGDALNRSGVHMFVYVSGSYGNSFSTWEATGDPGTHRMLAWQRTWSDVRNYTPIRYNGLAVTNPTARMSAISSYGVQWENSTGSYNVSPAGSILFTFDAARSSANVGSIYSWLWKINGTEVSKASRFNFTLGRGTHNVSLTITNTNGGISTATLQIIINEVQIIIRPTITKYSWTSIPTANVYFSGTVYGTSFLVGGTRLFFCNSSNICYEQPNSLVSVNSSTRLTVSKVWLSRGYWRMFVRTAAGDSSRSSSFYVR